MDTVMSLFTVATPDLGCLGALLRHPCSPMPVPPPAQTAPPLAPRPARPRPVHLDHPHRPHLYRPTRPTSRLKSPVTRPASKPRLSCPLDGCEGACSAGPPAGIGHCLVGRSQPAADPVAAGKAGQFTCRRGFAFMPGPGANRTLCYKQIGKPLTITSAAVFRVEDSPRTYSLAITLPPGDRAALARSLRELWAISSPS